MKWAAQATLPTTDQRLHARQGERQATGPVQLRPRPPALGVPGEGGLVGHMSSSAGRTHFISTLCLHAAAQLSGHLVGLVPVSLAYLDCFRSREPRIQKTNKQKTRQNKTASKRWDPPSLAPALGPVSPLRGPTCPASPPRPLPPREHTLGLRPEGAGFLRHTPRGSSAFAP